MKNSQEYIEPFIELIIKHFSSSCTREEEDVLRAWLLESKENKRYFDECHEIWVSGKLTDADTLFNSKEAFVRFKNRAEKTDSKPGTKKMHPRRISLSLYRTAALLLLFFSLGVVVRQLLHRDSPVFFSSFQEITVPSGSKSKVKLPDGTLVWLNAESKLVYSDRYNQEKREVRLEGEGYFKVAKDRKKPFIVQTQAISVQALGTEFNVKCYPDEGFIETTLINGVVRIDGNTSESRKISENVILKPNEKFTYIRKSGKLYSIKDSLNNSTDYPGDGLPDTRKGSRKEQMIVSTIDPTPLVAWKEEKLIFTGEPFEEIKPRLERWYGVNIQIQDSGILRYRFKGSLEKESLEQALEALQLASYFDYSIIKDKVIISK